MSTARKTENEGWEKCVAPLAVSHLKFFRPPKKWNVLLRHCHTSK